MENPIVTVGVITYNSSKYVLETLESIKAQTYQPLKLIIGDDCSTDNTVEICRQWIEENKSRFISSRIIVPEHNTGVSGNCNRTMDACDTDWYKEIAGDDILFPNCIEHYISFIRNHHDATIVFSKAKVFGPSREKIDFFNNFFDYAFFNLTPQKQYERLITKSNCIPAAAAFYNMPLFRKTGIRNDERIPLLEDLPKWVNLAKSGIEMEFIDEELVGYRVGESGLSSSRPNIGFSKSRRLHSIYYELPYWLEHDEVKAYKDIIQYEMMLWDRIEGLQDDLDKVISSPTFKLGSFLLAPLKRLILLFRDKPIV